ncbi:MAG: DUF1214 domain-containing protein [Acidimicrobiales bacterium]
MNQAPKTTAAFDELIALLQLIRDGYVLNDERFTDPLDVVEGYRYVGQLLSAASELFFEADPEHPRLASIVSPARKLQGDNPDAIYHYARISGSRSYRIFGRVDTECYTSFTIHGRAPDGALAGPLLGDVNDRQFQVDQDGSYSLTLSAAEQPGNWLRLDPDAYCVVVRSYFQLGTSAQNDMDVSVRIEIETIEDLDPPPPLSDEVFSERMREGIDFLRQTTLGQSLPNAPSPAPFVSQEPNVLPVPFSFRDSGLPVPGAADIFYAMGRWRLDPEEALVMTGTLPSCPFANVMLWNRHMQTLEYRSRRSSLNQSQIQLEPDGSYRIVIAHKDPGAPNWLDCEGHHSGTIFWRYLLPESDPTRTACEVLPIGEAADH